MGCERMDSILDLLPFEWDESSQMWKSYSRADNLI